MKRRVTGYSSRIRCVVLVLPRRSQMPYSGYPRPPQVSLRESRYRLTADSRCKPGGESSFVLALECLVRCGVDRDTREIDPSKSARLLSPSPLRNRTHLPAVPPNRVNSDGKALGPAHRLRSQSTVWAIIPPAIVDHGELLCGKHGSSEYGWKTIAGAATWGSAAAHPSAGQSFSRNVDNVSRRQPGSSVR